MFTATPDAIDWLRSETFARQTWAMCLWYFYGGYIWPAEEDDRRWRRNVFWYPESVRALQDNMVESVSWCMEALDN